MKIYKRHLRHAEILHMTNILSIDTSTVTVVLLSPMHVDQIILPRFTSLSHVCGINSEPECQVGLVDFEHSLIDLSMFKLTAPTHNVASQECYVESMDLDRYIRYTYDGADDTDRPKDLSRLLKSKKLRRSMHSLEIPDPTPERVLLSLAGTDSDWHKRLL